jgi:hypothetical protein
MNEPRALALMAGAAQRLADGMSTLQRLAETGDAELMICRQAIAVVEEYDLLRFYLREATLRGVIEPPARTVAVPTATPPAARKTTSTAQSKGGHARAATLPASVRQEIARKAAQTRWKR